MKKLLFEKHQQFFMNMIKPNINEREEEYENPDIFSNKHKENLLRIISHPETKVDKRLLGFLSYRKWKYL